MGNTFYSHIPVSYTHLGLEVSTGIGHFLLEGRYYMGLSDFYKNSKRDFFERSAHSFIGIRLSYLIDITK